MPYRHLSARRRPGNAAQRAVRAVPGHESSGRNASGSGTPEPEAAGHYFSVTVICRSTQVMVPPVKSLCLPPAISISSVVG